MAIPREPFGKLKVNPSLIKKRWARPERGKAESRGLRRDYTPAPQVTIAYLLGVLHDATERKTTFRIASKSRRFCHIISRQIKSMGFNAWMYKEGKNRDLWIVEFSKFIFSKAKIKSRQDKIDYVRGYFDAEGGIAKNPSVRYYIYFAQKDKKDLLKVRSYLRELGISCGKLHNPSKKIDPDYWRFFVGVKSYGDFTMIINSSHPEKRDFLRMKI